MIPRNIFLILLFLSIMAVSSCSKETTTEENVDYVAYVSKKEDSSHQKTFRELNIGWLLDFSLELPYADQSWVNIWVEGYEDGEQLKASPLIQLSYGRAPSKTSTGSIGFGTIDSADHELFFLYGPGVYQIPQVLDVNESYFSTGAIQFDYAFLDETIQLQSGETRVLAIFRHNDEAVLRTYDYYTQAGINEMIEEETFVMLLKIKVEKGIDKEGAVYDWASKK
ncbi:hypothetical protein [Cytobacillus sp. IB215665]|uniref:hypothetical protein n=1 Tax=Cytobacillus sp. IB215665 TaxID=3097357 RepID=UPI002A0AF1B0|nr:hypothetical protein [Cytobacillus sp. IB215665]MDX8366126.1 hypothetical protein [Cytobacillus sp. IB215665]